MGGIVIDIWEKSNFFGSFGSQKVAKKRDFCSGGALKAPPLMVGLSLGLNKYQIFLLRNLNVIFLFRRGFCHLCPYRLKPILLTLILRGKFLKCEASLATIFSKNGPMLTNASCVPKFHMYTNFFLIIFVATMKWGCLGGGRDDCWISKNSRKICPSNSWRPGVHRLQKICSHASELICVGFES